MSAYIVEDKTINRVVSWLVLEVPRNPESYYLQEKLSKLGYDLGISSSAEKLAKDMFELNVDAVRQRYGKEDQVPKFLYVPYIPASPIQTLKSLNCWVYQCTEGDVLKSNLYKFFANDLQKHLLKTIVYNLPDYDRAKWA